MQSFLFDTRGRLYEFNKCLCDISGIWKFGRMCRRGELITGTNRYKIPQIYSYFYVHKQSKGNVLQRNNSQLDGCIEIQCFEIFANMWKAQNCHTQENSASIKQHKRCLLLFIKYFVK